MNPTGVCINCGEIATLERTVGRPKGDPRRSEPSEAVPIAVFPEDEMCHVLDDGYLCGPLLQVGSAMTS